MIKNSYVKNILVALAVTVLGFILLNLTFIFDWGFQTLINRFFRADYIRTVQWFAPVKHIMFLAVIIFLSWLVFKSKLKTVFKAAYLMVPIAVTMVTIGIFSYQWPIISYTVGILIYGSIILYLYRTVQPWLYYYSATFVAVSLLIMGILGVEI